MPCWEQNLISVDLKVADKEMLAEALTSLGLKYQVTNDAIVVDTPQGRIIISKEKASLQNASCQAWLNKIKQAYSLKAVEKVAKKYKFNLTAKGGNKLVLRRY